MTHTRTITLKIDGRRSAIDADGIAENAARHLLETFNDDESIANVTAEDGAAGPMRAALTALVSTIDATGGVLVDENGAAAPCGDEDWLDLADAYLKACAALGRAPLIGG
jgi:hypothetical protein